MTEPTLFRKVFCKDRLPKEKGTYSTNLGELFFHGDIGFSFECPSWWLEQVPEPTVEEINKMASGNARHPQEGIDNEFDCYDERYYDGQFMGFIDGFKKALELLKGK